MKINKDKITQKLSKLDIEAGSKTTKFVKRKDARPETSHTHQH